MKRRAWNVALAIFGVCVFSGSSALCEVAKVKIQKKAKGLSVTVSGKANLDDCREFVPGRDGDPIAVKNLRGAWLGVTAVINGKEKDFPGMHVKGRFKKNYGLSIYDLREGGLEDVVWIAKLWRLKFTRDACAQKNGGEPCEWCKKNGYHFQDEVTEARE